MSRVGKEPVVIPAKVQVTINPHNEVIVKGGQDSETVKMRPEISAKVEGEQILVTRKDDSRSSRALHGLYRALIQNAVTGVSTGWSKSLELKGVGYRAATSGRKLELSLGYSHPISFDIPQGIDIKVDKQTTVVISGASRELVGQVAAKIRGFRPPEPFLGKGVRYSDEVIRRKAGKSGAK